MGHGGICDNSRDGSGADRSSVPAALLIITCG